jgi:hypothetical protein
MGLLNGHTAATFLCTGCAETLTFHNVANTAVPVILDRARTKGWMAPDFGKRNVFCPACAKARPKPVNDPDEELKKFTQRKLCNGQTPPAPSPPTPPTPPPPAPPSPPVLVAPAPPVTPPSNPTPEEPVMPEPVKMSAAAPPNTQAPPPPDAVRLPVPNLIPPLTTQQRLSIRMALDRHFDDEKGRYLGGQSDRSIAEAIGVPTIHVKAIREAAYGELRADPELLALQAEATELSRRLRDLEARISKLVAAT